ncbi:ABC-type nickel/cobalt efflux system permease component RcnA [Granulicella aggregans]|uniref:ABC-type nickel/cobalt efflux system permease component RcnA n=1 Tax=Granulicella aggregans TaxID=474949 RepID=A0A7W7Z9A4_9BACT|nr:ABC-type nickel/cobalt efflux system permease component RcnA [Granulicella aggregans]
MSRAAALVLMMVWAGSCLAHPMGNFSINHYSGIHIERDAIEVRYIIDIAEIPTYQEIQNAGISARADDPALRPYLAQQAAAWEKGLRLAVNGEAVKLSLGKPSVIFPPGAGGLPTMKIGVVYRGKVAAGDGHLRLHYSDGNYEGHAGWKEIVVTTGSGITLEGPQPFKVDRSAQLTDYPTNLLNSPPQDLEAEFNYSVAAPLIAESKPITPSVASASAKQSSANTDAIVKPAPAQPSALAPVVAAPEPDLKLQANKQATPRNKFTELMTRPGLGLGFLLTAAFLAAGLGAMHALEPGHGKTIVAAYLVGSRGKTRHAVGLGVLVTAAHTAGVYLLGAVVLYASKYVIPEQIYPWLSIFSGLVIAVMAVYMLLRAWTGVSEPDQDADGVMHSHWYSKKRDDVQATSDKTVSLKQLLLLGITGGIIPCPAALVVLLSAVSLHRIGLGLFLIVCFSLGLAIVLIAIGIAMVRARTLLSQWKSDSPWIQRYIPMASASAMLIAGLAIAATALPATGISFHWSSLTDGHAGSFVAIVALGLVLGMRHSTDPDHVVAVSTIVSRERSVKQGAIIGMMWGFGHTLTIFIVGAAIILFNLTIPPRIGLSMEMAVAAMLILLGVLNLTGVLRRLTERFTPAPKNDVLMDGAAPSSGAIGRLVSRFGYYHLLRPLAIGLVHGLAGSAAVALLVLSMIHSPAWAIAYLVIFGLGTVAGMMLMTTVMAIPVALTTNGSMKVLTTASGLVSVCFGLFLVYHLGFVDGLFTSHVHWTPE